MLSKEQAEKIKEQLTSQIESQDTPNKQQVIEQINSMNPEQLENFLIQNKLIKSEAKETLEEKTQECVFCLISEKKVPSYILDETKDNLTILEINPLSQGHSIIVPKKHTKIEKIPSSSFTLAKKIAKRIKSKFKPEQIDISTSSIMSHGIINIIPKYKNKKLERKKAKEEELILLQEKLKSKPKKTMPRKVLKIEDLPKKPRRIP